jgi:hypothetical protein
MEGMLSALSPKRKDHLNQLNPKLIQLIDKKLDSGNLVKLDQRLKKIQTKAN